MFSSKVLKNGSLWQLLGDGNLHIAKVEFTLHPLPFTESVVKMMCARCPVLEGNTADPPGHCIFDFYVVSSCKLLVLCSISILLTGRRSSNVSLPQMCKADLHTADTLLGGSGFALGPPSILSGYPSPLDQILAEHEIKLANCSPLLCLSIFFFGHYYAHFLCTYLGYCRV